MVLKKNSRFYRNATKLIEEYISSGKTVDELTVYDKTYRYIKDTKVFDENGKIIDLETKFELLGYPRKRKVAKNLREELIMEIKEYLNSVNDIWMETINHSDYPFLCFKISSAHSFGVSAPEEIFIPIFMSLCISAVD